MYFRTKSFSSSDLLTRAAPDNSDAISLAGAGSVSISSVRVLLYQAGAGAGGRVWKAAAEVR